MTPQEKAKDLYVKYGLLAVDHVQTIVDLNVVWYDHAVVKSEPEKYSLECTYEFWEDVLDELNNINEKIMYNDLLLF